MRFSVISHLMGENIWFQFHKFSKKKSLNSWTSMFLTISYNYYFKLIFLSLRKLVTKIKTKIKVNIRGTKFIASARTEPDLISDRLFLILWGKNIWLGNKFNHI